MKKHILATLLVAVTGVASAQVAITGKFGEIMDRTNGTNTMVIAPTSNIAISAKENLGNGLQARAVFDTSLGASTLGGTSTQLGDRQKTVGLSNNFGSLDMGRSVHSQFVAINKNDVFGTLYGSITSDVHNLRGLRFSDAVFTSVNGPFGVTVTYDRTQNNAGDQASAYSLSKSFAGINGTFAQYEQGLEKSTVVGLNTKIAGNTVSYIHSDNIGLVAKKGDTIGVARDLGVITAKASYGRTNTDVRAYAIGADYNLSKRTAVTVAYRNVDATQDIKQVGVGLVHKF